MISYDVKPLKAIDVAWVTLSIDGEEVASFRMTMAQWERLKQLEPRACRTREQAARRG